MSAQEAIWQGLDVFGEGLWWVTPILCAAAFCLHVVRVPPNHWTERVGRYTSLLGLAGIALSPFNSALGLLGGIVFFSGYLLTIAHRRSAEVASGRVRPSRQFTVMIDRDLSARDRHGHAD